MTHTGLVLKANFDLVGNVGKTKIMRYSGRPLTVE